MYHIGTLPFETERLLCRPFDASDAAGMHRNWSSNPHVQLEYGEPVCETISETEQLLAGYLAAYASLKTYRWAIIERESGENIGQIACCRVYSDCHIAEIEYCIGEAFWGRGYAGEALAGLLAFVFRKTEFQKLEAYHRAENRKSGRVLEKSVMRRTETVERFVRQGITPEGEICYCITRADFWKGVHVC